MVIVIRLVRMVTLSSAGKSQPARKTVKKRTPRIAAAIILSQLLKQQGSLASVLLQHVKDFTEKETAFIRELCYGCCRWYPLLNGILNQLLKQPLKKKETDIKAVLLLGLYQLQFLNTADHAAINESVNGAVFFKKNWAKKLINAVLRGFQREQEALFLNAQKQQVSAHPVWLENKIKSEWPEQADAIFSVNNQHPPLTLRINQQQVSRDQYLTTLADQGIVAKAAPFSSVGIYLEAPLRVTGLPLFKSGGFSVQDEAAQLSVELLDLKPGLNVLDACCAPGGKTCHIGEAEPAIKQITAIDIEERRLDRVHENLKRLNISAKIVCADAAQPDQWWDGELFDRILLDAPCSATGIIRRQPDIKLLRELEHIEALQKVQLKLLQALWPLLAEDGILVYATCSILPQENTQVVEQFIASQVGVSHQFINTGWGIAQPFGRQLFPSDQGHDGFFYAVLKKC